MIIIDFVAVMTWAMLIAFGSIVRTILGIYKAYDTYPDFRIEWQRIFVELVASIFFGGFGFYFLQGSGYFNFSLELLAPIAGLLGPDTIRLLIKKVGMTSMTQAIVSRQQMKDADLNDRETRAMLYVNKYGKINNSIYQKINFVGIDTAKRELSILMEKGRLTRNGVARGTNYTIPSKKVSGDSLAERWTSKTVASKMHNKTPDKNFPSVKSRLQPIRRIFQKPSFNGN